MRICPQWVFCFFLVLISIFIVIWKCGETRRQTKSYGIKLFWIRAYFKTGGLGSGEIQFHLHDFSCGVLYVSMYSTQPANFFKSSSLWNEKYSNFKFWVWAHPQFVTFSGVILYLKIHIRYGMIPELLWPPHDRYFSISPEGTAIFQAANIINNISRIKRRPGLGKKSHYIHALLLWPHTSSFFYFLISRLTVCLDAGLAYSSSATTGCGIRLT